MRGCSRISVWSPLSFETKLGQSGEKRESEKANRQSDGQGLSGKLTKNVAHDKEVRLHR